MEFEEFGSSRTGDAPLWFSVPWCVTDGPARVTVGSAEALDVTGTESPVELRVAFPDGPPFDRTSADEVPVPDAFVPVEDATGEVGSCGADRLRYAALAVVLPQSEDPVLVQDLRIDYEVDGEAYSELVDVDLWQCPTGTQPGEEPGRCPQA